MPAQFQYPETPWSEGFMRKAKYDPLPDEPTQAETRAAKGGMDYDVLKGQIGDHAADFIKRFDQKASQPGADQDLVKNWSRWRKYWIDMFGEMQGPSTPTSKTQEKAAPGYTSPFTAGT
jgi:hypothetical protein